MTMLHHYSFITNTSIQQLPIIRESIARSLNNAGIDLSCTQQLCLAIDEACSNIMLHAITDSDTTIKISLECHEDHCKVIIQDNASPFDPLNMPTMDMDLYFQQKKYGGLGIELMRRIIDDIEYVDSQGKHSWNTLSLTKYFNNTSH
jgi:serine/threonine-protein kinase RsbW